MNFTQYLIALATILLTKTATFALTIGSSHKIITIADQGGATKPIGFNLKAAAAIALTVISGQTGTIQVRVGNEIYSVTIQDAGPLTTSTAQRPA